MNLVVGHRGLLGSHVWKILGARGAGYPYRLEDPHFQTGYECAFLCAGTKGSEACEGNRAAFRADVDGNIRLARHLLKQGTFVVFVSSDAVEWSTSAYARNRWAVELAIGGLPNVAIFRPGRFDASNVADCAKACAEVGLQRREGLTRWP